MQIDPPVRLRHVTSADVAPLRSLPVPMIAGLRSSWRDSLRNS